jgi:hypothetical protein
MSVIRTFIVAFLVATPLAGCVIPEGSHTLSSGTSTAGLSWNTSSATTTRAALPTASQFSLKVIELSRDCFGSAGCSVRYRIVPTYIGLGSAPTGSFRLLYQVSGGDDAKTGNIEVRNGKFNNEENFTDVPTGGTLTAHVTQVLED